MSGRGLAPALLLAAGAALAAGSTVVARVNGAPITEAMVNAVVKDAISGSAVPPPSDEIARLSDAALESLIDLELLYGAAQKAGITVSDRQVEAEVKRYRDRFAKAADYDAALQRAGISAEQLRADTRKTLAVAALLERVVWKDVRLPPDAAQQYYEQHRAELGGKPFATLKPAIERSLLDERRDEARRAYLLELKKTAVIERVHRAPPPT